MIRTTSFIPAKLMLVAGLLTLASPVAFAAGALTSNTSTVGLTAILPESLSISVDNSAVSFNLVSGAAAQGDKPVNVTTSWVLNTTRQNVRLTGWFSSATAALTDGGTPAVNIPSSEVLGQVGAGSFTAFTQGPDAGGVGAAGASLNLFTQAITSANFNSSKAVTLNLEINLASQPQLPAGTYTGTLNLQADAL
jgi:hypothetical protein